MKKHLFILLLCCAAQLARAQEKLLYSTDFQNWAAISASGTETVVNKQTDFSNEQLTFKILQVAVNPSGRDETRFNYSDPGKAIVSNGWAQAAKVDGSYIETSPLKSITKVEFLQGATGSNRGYKLWKKNATDADWVLLSDSVANPSSGDWVSVKMSEENVALKFTNINAAQNAYMFDLRIYGNYVSANPQFDLTTSLNIAEAGSIVRNPNSDKYDQGTNVSLQANVNFGYSFVKWVDGITDAELSTANPYIVTMTEAKNIKAVFAQKATYSFSVEVIGSKWGEVKLSPLPTAGKYEAGTVVSMKVVPNQVTNFSYWDDNSTNTERTVVVDGNKAFTATFDEVPFIVGWDFRVGTPVQSRVGDYYSETTNTGLISAYTSNNAPVGWLATAAGFSPSLPCLRLWTPPADFPAARRYLKAQFSTENYTNIQVKSLVSANYQSFSKHILQYSLDDVTYKPVDTVDISSNYNSTWAELSAVLPQEAEGKAKLYVRWLQDETSTRLGNAVDVDGSAYTNVFVYADKQAVVDNDAPVLVATVPVAASSTATVNGAVVLTFNEKVKPGTGSIMLGDKAVTGVFGSKTASFSYERLNYNTEYTFTVPAGALTDASGNAFAGVSFSFKTANRTEPAKKLFDVVVAKDGTGDYTSVIDAIAAAPTGRALPWLIYIKAGKYTGHHDIPSNKPFIHLIGQHRDSVIISDNRLSGGDNAVHVSLGATMVVNAKDCYFENITFENSWGHEQQAGPQALALYTLTDRFTMNRCFLRSYQDTYLTAYSSIADRHYIKNSRIQGAVDFIYGGGDVFFDKCDIVCTRKDGGYIVAPSHGVGTAWGYVFSNCTIDEAVQTGVTTYFGRPWQNKPKTVFLNTILKAKVYAVGWHYKMGAIPEIFADYNTMDAQGNPVDLSQRISQYEYDVKDANGNVINTVTGTAKNSLTNAEAANYTYENVILRNGDTWNPRLMTEAPVEPMEVVLMGAQLKWRQSAYSRLYIVFKNGRAYDFTTDTVYVDPSPNTNSDNNYAVQAVGEFGALSLPIAATISLPATGLTLQAKAVNKNVQLSWKTLTEANTAYFELEHSADGSNYAVIGKTVAAGNSNAARHYQFTHTNVFAGNHVYRVKLVDKDGSFEYSPIANVRLLAAGNLQVIPTLASDAIMVLHDAADAGAQISIINAAGQVVKRLNLSKGASQTNIGISDLRAGAYLVSYQGSFSKTVRFIKL